MKVKDCMCESVCSVKPETKIIEVVKIMQSNHIGWVPVCDNTNTVCGILTDRDILLRTVANNKDVNTTAVSDIMSTEVCTCCKNDDISKAQNKMATNQVRRLPVCDESNKVIGILTLGDLAQSDAQIGSDSITRTMSDICNCNTNKNNG